MIVVPVEKRIDWKRPPVVLIALVLINILVFVFYQSGDAELVEEAISVYHSNELLEVELPAYKAYMRKADPSFEIDESDPFLSWYIVSDTAFASFIDERQKRYVKLSKRSKWKRARAQLKEITDQISSNAFGLNPNNVSIINLLSHQFLHGGIDHLLGNLVFLILTGFAVEAALGSLRFLGYYLVAGVGGGALFAFIESSSGGGGASLIGASGAISGVMAMYVVLFGARKIEFFYWLFVFTGYFRAAAILMLPAYVLKELAMLFFGGTSNVAYTAHVGGFLAGALMVYATQMVYKKAIDDEYLDADEDVSDPHLDKLEQIYNDMGQCEFKRAWPLLREIKAKRPGDPELIEIEYNLINALNAAKAKQYLMERLGKNGNSQRMIQDQLQQWHGMPAEERARLSFHQRSSILQNGLEFGRGDMAEKIFKELSAIDGHESELAVLARKIALFFKSVRQDEKSRRYDQRARQLMQAQAGEQGAEA